MADDNQSPGYPALTAMVAAAAATHEMFRSYIDAGFTEDQAIKFCVSLIIAHQASERAKRLEKRVADLERRLSHL